MPAQTLPVTLASASPYRRELLARLNLAFEICPTNVDETPRTDESAAALATRLAAAKAAAVGDRPGLIIGSDQTALCGVTILGKPGSAANARRQLAACSGRTVVFYTAVALRGEDAGGTPVSEDYLDITSVRFRDLDAGLIERYVAADQPTDCAGGFKAEAAGPVLFSAITATDPTGIVGLPLCWLAGALERYGAALLGAGPTADDAAG